MSKKLIIAKMPLARQECTAIVLQEDGRTVDFFLEKRTESPILGNIYLGRVERLQPGLDAAFVRLGEIGNGYLPLSEIDRDSSAKKDESEPLHSGDAVLVQVSKEAMKGKLPRLTTGLSLAGRRVVLTSQQTGLQFSRELTPEARERLLPIARPLHAELPFGVILRTQAAEADEQELSAEIRDLAKQMRLILDAKDSRVLYSCLYRENARWHSILERIPDGDAAEVQTDDEDVYEGLLELREAGQISRDATIDLYRDNLLPLYKLHDLGGLLEHLTSKRVWLKSGAYLVIEQTEAFVSIDVNTGKYDRGKSTEEVIRKINREAACEIARQLRLRQLSGIILIDFINIRGAEEKRALLAFMREQLLADPVRTVVVDLTKLGIMELTREKRNRPLAEQMKDIREQESAS